MAMAACTFTSPAALYCHPSCQVDPDELLAHMLAAGAISEADLAMHQASEMLCNTALLG
jgi:hypothetical protein